MSILSLDVLKLLEATEQAAINCYDYIGRGDEKSADQAAVNAMRSSLNNIDFKAKIVIGEGERDEAPMLFIGEEVGLKKDLLKENHFDIAVDPLEGTTICAQDLPGSLAVLAIAESGSLLNAPDVYMDKIASYIPSSEQVIDLDESIENNLKNIAKYNKSSLTDLKVIILNRPRHQEIIDITRKLGARVKLIGDGDIAAVLSVAMKQADLYLGIGGAPEGVLAAAALKTLGGQMMGRLMFKNDHEKSKATKLGITDLNQKYFINDLVKKDAIFYATGVTTGALLNGVQKTSNGWLTNSLILSSANKKILNITNQTFVSQ